jgi:hypothetical protein
MTMTISESREMNEPLEMEVDRTACASPDIMLGAYLVSHLRAVCENCGATGM